MVVQPFPPPVRGTSIHCRVWVYTEFPVVRVRCHRLLRGVSALHGSCAEFQVVDMSLIALLGGRVRSGRSEIIQDTVIATSRNDARLMH